MVKKKLISILVLFAMVALFAAPAMAGYNIQSRGTTTGPLQSIVNFFQSVVDLIDGPLALAIVVISLIAAIAMWNFAPQGNRAFGIAARACASGILLFNIATMITWLTGM
jgi:type IV secretory pathway VirB2 component (pilin)